MQESSKLNHYVVLFLAALTLPGFSSPVTDVPVPTAIYQSPIILDGHIVLETERTIIRPLQSQDAEALISVFSDPDSIEMGAHDFDRETIDGLTAVPPLRNFSLNWDKINFAIVLKANHRVIGTVQLSKVELDTHSYGLQKEEIHIISAAAIGYAISKEFWGKGIATEVVRKMVKFSFSDLGITQIFAETIHSNISSQRVLIKAGFKKTGEGITAIGKKGPYFILSRGLD